MKENVSKSTEKSSKVPRDIRKIGTSFKCVFITFSLCANFTRNHRCNHYRVKIAKNIVDSDDCRRKSPDIRSARGVTAQCTKKKLSEIYPPW